MRITDKDRARFESKVDRSAGPDACHTWTTGRFSGGYGSFWLDGMPRHANRVAWVIAHGPIADGLCVCHRCDTPICVNVAHLFLGTHAENVADKVSKGRQAAGPTHSSRTRPEALCRGDRNGRRLHPERYPTGERMHSAKLTEDAVREIRQRRRAGETLVALGARFGVHHSVISEAARGLTWRHVSEVEVRLGN